MAATADVRAGSSAAWQGKAAGNDVQAQRKAAAAHQRPSAQPQPPPPAWSEAAAALIFDHLHECYGGPLPLALLWAELFSHEPRWESLIATNGSFAAWLQSRPQNELFRVQSISSNEARAELAGVGRHRSDFRRALHSAILANGGVIPMARALSSTAASFELPELDAEAGLESLLQLFHEFQLVQWKDEASRSETLVTLAPAEFEGQVTFVMPQRFAVVEHEVYVPQDTSRRRHWRLRQRAEGQRQTPLARATADFPAGCSVPPLYLEALVVTLSARPGRCMEIGELMAAVPPPTSVIVPARALLRSWPDRFRVQVRKGIGTLVYLIDSRSVGTDQQPPDHPLGGGMPSRALPESPCANVGVPQLKGRRGIKPRSQAWVDSGPPSSQASPVSQTSSGGGAQATGNGLPDEALALVEGLAALLLGFSTEKKSAALRWCEQEDVPSARVLAESGCARGFFSALSVTPGSVQHKVLLRRLREVGPERS